MDNHADSTGGEMRMDTTQRKLIALGCPYAQSDRWDEALLTGPGDFRLQLIEWLLYKIDHRLKDANMKTAGTDGRREQRLTRLFGQAALIGLCSANDNALVEGGNVAGELRMIASAIELAKISSVCEQAEADDKENCRANGSQGDVQLFPADVLHNAQPAGPGCKDIRVVGAAAEELAAAIDEKRVRLAMLDEKFPHNPAENNNDAAKAYDEAIAEVRIAMTKFNALYERDFRQWTNNNAPAPSPIGPTASRVLPEVEKFEAFMASLETLRRSYEMITDQTSQRARALASDKKGILAEGSLDRLRENILVIQAAIQRRRAGF